MRLAHVIVWFIHFYRFGTAKGVLADETHGISSKCARGRYFVRSITPEKTLTANYSHFNTTLHKLLACDGLYWMIVVDANLSVNTNRNFAPWTGQTDPSLLEVVEWLAGMGVTPEDVEDCVLYAQVWIREGLDAREELDHSQRLVQAAQWVANWIKHMAPNPIDAEWWKPVNPTPEMIEDRKIRVRPYSTFYSTSAPVDIVPETVKLEPLELGEMMRLYVHDQVGREDDAMAVEEPTYDVFAKNAEDLQADWKPKDAARKLILKIVNALTSKLEIGSPMAAMYLLDHPDHYTDHEFVPFWWQSYVNEIERQERCHLELDTQVEEEEYVCKDLYEGQESDTEDIDDIDNDPGDVWSDTETLNGEDKDATEDEEEGRDEKFKGGGYIPEDKGILLYEEGKVIYKTAVDNYKYRPPIYEHLNLVDWITYSQKKTFSKKKRERMEKEDLERDESSESEWADIDELNTVKYVRYHKDHPQYSSQEVNCNIERT
ncbi:hypothetical protein CC2G_010864 [Coprinopsis cinerea AmutBmut pab1-1]|nr:hypothetical protein CC2G_010864 [Coprinopsis cinerea AmutBmut pab1-1]